MHLEDNAYELEFLAIQAQRFCLEAAGHQRGEECFTVFAL